MQKGIFSGLLVLLAAVLVAGTNPNLKYIGYWDIRDYSETAGMANFEFFKENWDQVRDAKAHGLNVLWNCEGTLFTTNPDDKNRVILRSDFVARWNSAKPIVQQYLANGTIFGIFFGDELIWSGLPYADFRQAIHLVRSSFPSNFVLYYNEAWPVFSVNKNIFWEDAHYTTVPTELDWVSTDFYPDVVGSSFYPNVTNLYEKFIYPRMSANQKVLYVPPGYATVNDPARFCGQADCSAVMMKWANDAFEYADKDTRWIGLNPWHWISYSASPRHHSNGYELGIRDLPAVRKYWLSIANDVIHRQH
eukprot:TRINITY_DN589_c0_g1_i1.p1 TRINITY_DN589_c0_g1~~TRINITY_DN589_c0_g1_i1.p1  ORF type:complete len:305 (+),score=51.74 TRINITY_DN589_c0_g1_i1:102-1016(+)